MDAKTYILITDRGGHLHNALKLVEQIGVEPGALVTTQGPDVDALVDYRCPVHRLPHLFKWFGKLRLLNPFSLLVHFGYSLYLAVNLRPRKVISLGASNVVAFCIFSRLLGAEIYHVECMNQVQHASITGRLLYPFCKTLFVQWEELLFAYGPKAQYQGWVL